MRWISKMVVLTLVVLVIGGCVKQEKQDSQHIRIAVSIEPESLNPFEIVSADVIAMFDNTYDALLTYDSDGAIIANLAQQWQVFDKNQRYEVTLRDDILFHNAVPLKANDVVHTYKTYAQYNSRFGVIEQVLMIDDYTVEFLLKEANADFINLLATTWIFSEAEGVEPQSGTGAYRFDSYEAGRVLHFSRYDDSFHNRQKMAYFEKLDFLIIKESASILLGLQSGAIDLATQLDPMAVGSSMQERFQVQSTPQNLTNLMALNNATIPFNDLRVRQAVNLAVDKDAFLRLLVGGDGVRLDTGLSPILAKFYNHDLDHYYEYNPVLAKELLEDAGYGVQNPLKFVVRVPSNYAMHVRSAEIIASQLALSGIEMQLEAVEWATWLSEVYQNRKYQATIVGLTGKLSPYQQLVRYSSKTATNFTNFENSVFEQVLAAALVSSDLDEQIALYKEAQRILTQEANSLFLLDPNLMMIAKRELTGWKNYPLQTFRVREYALSS